MSNDSVCMCNTHYIYLSEWSIYVFITFLYFSVCLPKTGLTCSCSKSQEQNQCLIFLCATFNGIARVFAFSVFFVVVLVVIPFVAFLFCSQIRLNKCDEFFFVCISEIFHSCLLDNYMSVSFARKRMWYAYIYIFVCNNQFMCWFFFLLLLYIDKMYVKK
jgi:hypothetical protein